MARRRSRIPGESIRMEAFAIIFGLTVALLIASTILVFFPTLQWQEGAWEISLSWAFWIMPWAFGFWGLILGFRYYTDKVIWDNWVVECSNQKEIPLGTVSMSDTEGRALPDPTLTPAQAENLTTTGAIANMDAPRRNVVGVSALGFGGFWAWKFADYPGKEGYGLFYGNEYIKVGGNVFIPKHRVYIHHSQVDQRLLTALELATKDSGEGRFISYKTPLYRCGDMLPEVVNFMCDNDEIRTGVIARIGVPGVAREFAANVLREIGPEKARQIGLSMKGWEALIDPAEGVHDQRRSLRGVDTKGSRNGRRAADESRGPARTGHEPTERGEGVPRHH